MANKLPMLEESSVASRPMPTEYARANASPTAFGAGVGEAIVGVGAEMGRQAQQERATAATFASADAELRFGTEMDGIVAEYKKELAAKQAGSSGEYEKTVGLLRDQYVRKVEDARSKYEKELRDPLAQKTYTVRTRLQTQAAMRGMLEHGNTAVLDWRGKVADSSIKEYQRRAGNITGNVEADVANLQLQVGLGSKVLQDYFKSNAVPPETAALETRKFEVAAVKEALEGYGSNHEAILAFLGSKLPGTNVTIGFDAKSPTHPPMTAEDSSILNAAETAVVRKYAEGFKKEKVGADIGESLFQARNEPGFNLEDRISKLYNEKDAAGNRIYSGDELGKARQHFDNAISGAERRRNIVLDHMYDEAYTLVTKKYGGNIEDALAAKDGRFLELWNGMGPDQVKLRSALTQMERQDPAAFGPYGQVIDMSSEPGRLAATFPTTAAFARQFQGPTAHLWPQALEIYKRDVSRDVTQDSNYQTFRRVAELRARSALGFEADWMKDWSQTGDDQQNAYIWFTTSVDQMWADHQYARKSAAPGARETDANWYAEGVNKLADRARSMLKSGAFSGKMPRTDAPQPRKAYEPPPPIPKKGERRIVGTSEFEWDGSNWQRVK